MRGRWVGMLLLLVVVLTPAFFNFSGTSAQSEPIPFPTPVPTETPMDDMWRNLQPTADPNLVPLPRLNNSVPGATAAPSYGSNEDMLPQTGVGRSFVPGQAVQSVNFGDVESLISALNDSATREIYLIPDENNTVFTLNNTQYLIFNHSIKLYANNAVFEPDASSWNRALLTINSSMSVEIYQIHIRNAHFNATGAYGGAIRNYGYLTLESSSFTNNHSSTGGGAIYNESGNLNINRTIFENNTSSAGGAIQNDWGGHLTIACSRFAGNYASYGGGILQGSWGVGIITVNHSSFVGNTATLSSSGADIHSYTWIGAIDASSNWWGGDGASVYKPDGGVRISNALSSDPTTAPYNFHPECKPDISVKLPPPSGPECIGYVTGSSGARVRAQPYVSDNPSNVVTTLENGVTLAVVGKTTGADQWYRVRWLRITTIPPVFMGEQWVVKDVNGPILSVNETNYECNSLAPYNSQGTPEATYTPSITPTPFFSLTPGPSPTLVPRIVGTPAVELHSYANSLQLPYPFDIAPVTEEILFMNGFGPYKLAQEDCDTTDLSNCQYKGTYSIHTGIDYYTDPSESAVLAVCDGVIVPGRSATNSGGSATLQSGKGLSLRCFANEPRDGDGDGARNLSNIIITYNHLSKAEVNTYPPINSYVIVRKGQQIGVTAPYTDSNGNPQQAHLHMEVFFANGYKSSNRAIFINPIFMFSSQIPLYIRLDNYNSTVNGIPTPLDMWWLEGIGQSVSTDFWENADNTNIFLRPPQNSLAHYLMGLLGTPVLPNTNVNCMNLPTYQQIFGLGTTYETCQLDIMDMN